MKLVHRRIQEMRHFLPQPSPHLSISMFSEREREKDRMGDEMGWEGIRQK